MTRLARSLAVALVLIAPSRGVADDAGTAPSPVETERRAQAIVRGQGVEITVGEVEDLIAQQGPAARIRYRDPAQLRLLVDNLARAELLAAEAARRGYEQNAAVRYTVKDSAAQALVRAEVEDKITPDAIPLDDVRAYYDAHPDEFHRPGMRRASFILLDSEDDATKLLPQAKKADARAFSELAKQHSRDVATKTAGGDLGYFMKDAPSDAGAPNEADAGALTDAVRSAAFTLREVGDTSAPLAIEGKHAIVRLTGERPERHVSLEDATASIRAKLWRERRQQALDALFTSLREREKPQVFETRVNLISFDDMEKRPAGFALDPAPAPADAKAKASPP